MSQTSPRSSLQVGRASVIRRTRHGHQASTLVVLDWLVDHGQRLVSPGTTGSTDRAQDLKSSRHHPGLSRKDVVVELHLSLRRPVPPERPRLRPSALRGTHIVLINELDPRTPCLRVSRNTMTKMRYSPSCLGEDLSSSSAHSRSGFWKLVRLRVERSEDDGNMIPSSTTHVPLLCTTTR